MKHVFEPLPPQRNLKNLFDYNRETGLLTRAVTVGPRAVEGHPAGYTRRNSKLQYVMVDGQEHRVSRVVWKMVTGEEPGAVIHLDGDSSNMRFVNLARADSKYALPPGTTKPRRRDKRNTSGVTGVSFNARLNRWHAKLGHAGKQIHLGVYATMEEAINARLAAERRYGYPPQTAPVTPVRSTQPVPAPTTHDAGRSTQPDPDAAAFGAS